MASGQVNRIRRPDTWLHRPMPQNVKKIPCQPGAVHTWHETHMPRWSRDESGHPAEVRLSDSNPEADNLAERCGLKPSQRSYYFRTLEARCDPPKNSLAGEKSTSKVHSQSGSGI
jgi:hypothetical protein